MDYKRNNERYSTSGSGRSRRSSRQDSVQHDSPRRQSRRNSDESFNNETHMDEGARRRLSRSEYTRENQALQARRKKQRTLKIALSVLGAIVIICAGSAFAYYQVLAGNLSAGIDQDLKDALVETDLDNEPFYMLLMGTDGSEERQASAEYANDPTRCDTIMLARIDPVENKVTIVSLHRDTMVELEGYGTQKLNAAYVYGGAALAVETVSEMAGVPISHYAEVNFDGLEDIVNALGGIEVDVPVEINDADAGGYVAAGQQVLTGEEALILCRSRYTYADYADPDSYRAANQRLVLSAIVEKILAADVVTMASTVQALSQSVTTDLAVMDIIGLAQTMQGLNPATDMYTAMEPTTSDYIDGVWYEITNQDEWALMMDRIDQGLPPTESDLVDSGTGTVLATTGGIGSEADDSRTGTVAVRNGNGTAGAGIEASEQIEALGYTTDSANADNFNYTTTMVVFKENSQSAAAQEIVEALGAGAIYLDDGTFLFETDFLVVLGADWTAENTT